MKSSLLFGLTWLLNIKFRFLPAPDLFIMLGICIALDFVTGITKSLVLKKPLTSFGYRKTIIKFMQYGGAIAVGLLLKYTASRNPEFFQAIKYVDWLTTGLIIFIIFIEVTSILENVNELDQKTPFSRFIIKPLLKLFTFQIRNNPLAKTAQNDNNTQTTA